MNQNYLYKQIQVSGHTISLWIPLSLSGNHSLWESQSVSENHNQSLEITIMMAEVGADYTKAGVAVTEAGVVAVMELAAEASLRSGSGRILGMMAPSCAATLRG